MHQSTELSKRVLQESAFRAFMVTAIAAASSFFGRSFLWVFFVVATAHMAWMGVHFVAGVLASRRAECRPLHLFRRDLALRSVLKSGDLGIWLFVPMMTRSGDASDLLWAVFVGTSFGLISLREKPALSKAERHYGRALLCLRKGDQEGARRQAKLYIEHAEDDPERKLRRPAAEAFLRGETDTLDVMATELEATSAPAGRGTEVSAAERPEGTGTELESVEGPHVASEGVQATPGRERSA